MRNEPLAANPLASDARPYRGLLAFEPEHRRFFFGRGELERELVLRVRASMGGWGSRFQVVVGASGSGKSSLVLAGLVPRLHEDAREPWDTVVLRPGEVGAHRMLEVEEGPGRFSSLGRLRALLSGLHRQDSAPTGQGATVAEVLREARGLREAGPERWLLVVVDQLEELFTQVATVEEREALMRALWRLAHTPEVRVVVVATLRVDALGRCEHVRVDHEGPQLESVVYSAAHRLFVGPPRAEQLVDIIQGPARVVGLHLEPGLVEALRRDVEQEPGALPLLEHALDQLWERRAGSRLTRAAYEELGGVVGAMARTGDRLYESLPEAERHQARRLLARLVDLREEMSPHARREGLKQLRPEREDEAAAFDAVVEKLVRHRLVVRGEDGGQPPEPWLRLAHEALIRRWGRLVEWVREARGQKPRASEAEIRERERTRYARDVARVLQARRLLEWDLALAVLVLREVAEPERTPEWHPTVLEALHRGAMQPVVLAGHEGRVELAAFGADGERVLTGSADGTARVWRADGAGEPVVLSGHEGGVWSAELSADGARVLTTSQEGRVRVWRADGAGEPVVLAAYEERVWPTEFSPDGQRVLSVSEDGTVRVGLADGTGEPVMLRGHGGRVSSA
ncbi:hypothetical protein, partial [Archangium violaceum]